MKSSTKKTQAQQSKYLTPTEACELLRIDPSTLRRYARKGAFSRIRLSHKKVLYVRAEIEAFISERTYRPERLSEKRGA